MHPWDKLYGLPVLRGEVTIGELAYLAVERHYNDLLAGFSRGLVFNPKRAYHVVDYIEKFFCHIKGQLTGTRLKLSPWQLFWTAVLYGWENADGSRRFRIGYEEVARKNGKSTWKAPQGAYMLMCDQEPGAEVYVLATTRDQAMSVFAVALANMKRLSRLSAGIKRSFSIHDGKNQEQILFGDAAMYRPLPANADSLDGKNPHCIIFDELHAQKTSDLWAVMVSAFGARKHPLLSSITTAGFILDGVCVDQRNYLISILQGKHIDDSYFGYVYTLDDDDDVFDELNWYKANPALGDGKSIDYMRSMARQAKSLPSALANFKTKDLNLWVNSADGWFDVTVWDQGKKPFDTDSLRNRPCFGGIDLAATRDLTSFVLVFPPHDDENWYVLHWSYCPQAKVDNQALDAAPYSKWQSQGYLHVTPGDITDYEPMAQQIRDAVRTYDVQEIAFDKWNSTHLVNQLSDDFPNFVDLPQRFEGMYPGSKKLEELVYSKRLRHGGDPVLRWAVSNVSLLFDTNGNFRPDKKRSNPSGRIDPVVALVMALSRASVHVQDDSGYINDPIVY